MFKNALGLLSLAFVLAACNPFRGDEPAAEAGNGIGVPKPEILNSPVVPIYPFDTQFEPGDGIGPNGTGEGAEISFFQENGQVYIGVSVCDRDEDGDASFNHEFALENAPEFLQDLYTKHVYNAIGYYSGANTRENPYVAFHAAQAGGVAELAQDCATKDRTVWLLMEGAGGQATLALHAYNGKIQEIGVFDGHTGGMERYETLLRQAHIAAVVPNQFSVESVFALNLK